MPESQLDLLNKLAHLRGLGEAYFDQRGELRRFSTESCRAILQAMSLEIADEAALRIAVTNETRDVAARNDPHAIGGRAESICFQPRVLDKEKCWGLSIQLYSLRSSRNWGIGDFADLRELIELAAPLGCDVIGINPLHAAFPADPLHCSPYSPSSRLFLNGLYIAIDAIPEFPDCASAQSVCAQAAFQAALTGLRSANNVMYEQVAALKFQVLRLLHGNFRESHIALHSPRARSFSDYIARRGEPLHLHAVFDALDEHFRTRIPMLLGWQQWPIEYRDPHSNAVREFAAAHPEKIEFFMYLQWLADQQIAAVQESARAKGMRIGLYGDLAVGANPAGSEVWSNQSLYVLGASVGAPPDPLALNGQDWRLPPIDPNALRKQRLQPFVELVRANMQHAGALRIDHVMSLFRLWWVPRGFSAAEGVYVHYPLDELVEQLAKASAQAQCLIIGEDLGTVPDEVRHAMAVSRLYHYKVLLFEKHDDGRFKLPHEYQRQAVATATTHDLPPLKSWWQGDDLTLRDRLHLYPSVDTARLLRDERAADRFALLRVLSEAGLWHWREHEPLPEFSPAFVRAIHLYLGETNAALVLVQLEDLIGMTDPVNVPGTHVDHANWQRKISATTQDIFKSDDVCESLAALSAARAKC